jgi:membrane protein required for colicin V production
MFESISLIDVAVIVLVLFFAFFGYFKGFANQIASFLALLLLGLVLYFVYPPLFNYLTDLFNSLNQTVVVWVLIILFTVLSFFFFILMNKLLVKMLKFQISETADHLYGVVLGLFRGIIIALLGLSFIVILGPEGTRGKVEKKSHIGRFTCQRIVHHIQPYLTPSVIKKGVKDLQNKMKRTERDLLE